MNPILPGVKVPLTERTLELLLQECQEQIEEYSRDQKPENDTSSCDEILRRASEQDVAHTDDVLTADAQLKDEFTYVQLKDELAFSQLLEVSRSLIQKNCPKDLREMIEEVQAKIWIKLIRKFHNPGSPYKADGFVRYRSYLKVVMK